MDNHQAIDMQSTSQGVTVVTNKGTFRGRKLVLTPGSWGPAMLETFGVDLPLKVYIHSYCIWILCTSIKKKVISSQFRTRLANLKVQNSFDVDKKMSSL